MKYAVVCYESSDLMPTRGPELFPAHSARIDEFRARGEILVGTFGDPMREGAMAIFPSRGAAESFVAGDPFVLEGVVRGDQVRDWNEIIT